RREEELRFELELPLLSQGGGDDEQDAAPTLSPLLREYEACFDRLSEPDLVRQQRPSRVGRAKREERRVDLMRVEIDPRVADRTREPIDGIAWMREEETVRPIAGVKWSRHAAGSPGVPWTKAASLRFRWSRSSSSHCQTVNTRKPRAPSASLVRASRSR